MARFCTNGQICTADGIERPYFQRPALFFLDGLRAPDITYGLTLKKGCRFSDVELDENGILTKGHLWELGHIIRTVEFRRRLPWVNVPGDNISLNGRRRLAQLASELRRRSQVDLAQAQLLVHCFQLFLRDLTKVKTTCIGLIYQDEATKYVLGPDAVTARGILAVVEVVQLLARARICGINFA